MNIEKLPFKKYLNDNDMHDTFSLSSCDPYLSTCEHSNMEFNKCVICEQPIGKPHLYKQ